MATSYSRQHTKEPCYRASNELLGRTPRSHLILTRLALTHPHISGIHGQLRSLGSHEKSQVGVCAHRAAAEDECWEFVACFNALREEGNGSSWRARSASPPWRRRRLSFPICSRSSIPRA